MTLELFPLLPVRSSSGLWTVVGKCEPGAVALADRHYSRRKVGSPQFMPPGQTLVLVADRAVWGWWRPDPKSGIRAMNNLDGWTCTIFRNEGPWLSSRLVLAAEEELRRDGRGCGPDGMLTFKVAGWRRRGLSADGRKVLLGKPWDPQ